jgi:DNA adenine methylase
LLTCDDSPEIRKFFSFAHIVPWDLAYGMTNVKKNKARRGDELLISNYNISKFNKTSTLENFESQKLDPLTVNL